VTTSTTATPTRATPTTANTDPRPFTSGGCGGPRFPDTFAVVVPELVGAQMRFDSAVLVLVERTRDQPSCPRITHAGQPGWPGSGATVWTLM
jgi:hypothetical protein